MDGQMDGLSLSRLDIIIEPHCVSSPWSPVFLISLEAG